MADLEELIERSARSICIAAGYEPEQWADNEDLRNRCLKYAKVAIEAYESAKQKGEAEGWVLVPREPTNAMLWANAGTSDTHKPTWNRAMWAAFLAAAPEPPMLSAGGEG